MGVIKQMTGTETATGVKTDLVVQAQAQKDQAKVQDAADQMKEIKAFLATSSGKALSRRHVRNVVVAGVAGAAVGGAVVGLYLNSRHKKALANLTPWEPQASDSPADEDNVF